MMGMGEAARIFITVGLDAANATHGLAKLGKEVDGFSGKVGTWKTTMGAALQGPLDMFGKIGDAGDGLRMTAQAVGGLAETLFSGAARNEQYAMSFEVLMGSAEAANAHLAKLKDFATETPFTLPGIVEVSRQLEVMGGSALNTIENMRLVGDVASGTGTDIERVGVQFGRLYDGLKNGTPLGEVMMRLGEMGAVSGESRRKILKLAESVKSGAITMEEAWASASGEFGRFAGLTGKQAETLGGLWSTFTDTIDEGFAKIGTKLLPIVKPVLKGAIKLFEGLADAAIYVMDNIEAFAPLIIAFLVPAIAVLTAWMWGLASAVIAATWPFIAIGAAIAAVVFIAMRIADAIGWLIGKVQEIGPAILVVLGPLGVLPAVLGAVGDALGLFGDKAEEGVGRAADALDVGTQQFGSDLAAARDAIRTGANAVFEPLITGATNSKAAVDAALDAIVLRITGFRDEVKAAAEGVASAMYDPVIAAAEVAAAEIALAKAKETAALEKAGSRAAIVAEGEVARIKKDLDVKKALLKTYGTDAERLAYAASESTWAKWNKAQNEANPELKQAMQDKWELLHGTYMDMQNDSSTMGTAVGLSYSSGLGAEQARRKARTSALGLHNAAGNVLDNSFYADGANAGQTFANGIVSKIHAVQTAARRLLNGARGALEFNSPPKEGPWKKIDVWGERAGQTWADSLAAQAGYLSGKTREFLGAGDLMSSAVPALASAPSGRSMTAPAPAGGGFVIEMNFNSAVPYTPGEMEEMGRRVGPSVYEYLRSRGAVG